MTEIRVPLGPLAAQPDGTLRRYRAGFRGVWIWRRGETARGYYDFCTHQGGALQRVGDRMVCTRHEAVFGAEGGERLEGEAPEGSRLPPADIRVENGTIMLVIPQNDV